MDPATVALLINLSIRLADIAFTRALRAPQRDLEVERRIAHTRALLQAVRAGEMSLEEVGDIDDILESVDDRADSLDQAADTLEAASRGVAS